MTTPVSGPGPMSQRTDMTQKMRDLPDADYGEQAAYSELQGSAPIAASGGMDFNSIFGNAADRVVPIGAESQWPEVPVTDGAAMGPGRGMEALNIPNQDEDTRARLSSYLPVLEYLANRPGSSSAARNLVRRIKSEI